MKYAQRKLVAYAILAREARDFIMPDLEGLTEYDVAGIKAEIARIGDYLYARAGSSTEEPLAQFIARMSVDNTQGAG